MEECQRLQASDQPRRFDWPPLPVYNADEFVVGAGGGQGQVLPGSVDRDDPVAAANLYVPYLGSLLALAWTFLVPVFCKGPLD